MNKTLRNTVVAFVFLAVIFGGIYLLGRNSDGGLDISFGGRNADPGADSGEERSWPKLKIEEHGGHVDIRRLDQSDPGGKGPDPPPLKVIQECDALVIDAWRRLNNIQKEFLTRYTATKGAERRAMSNELNALFFEYEPFNGGEIPASNESTTPPERARNEIWVIGRKFETAIEQDPENPNNYVSFAIFLKPRNEKLAIENFKRGIEHWPKNYASHFLLADYYYRGFASNRFSISKGLNPHERRKTREDEIFALLDSAAEHDPQNAFIALYRAQAMITFERDAVDILRQLEKANATPGKPFFLLPPPRPAKLVYWLDAASILRKIQALHYDIQANYGFYLRDVIKRYITKGGLREAAERTGPDAFATIYAALGKMADTLPLDRSFFSLIGDVAQVMEEYYSDRGNSEAVLSVGELQNAVRFIEDEMRTKCKTDKDFKKRMKEGVDPSDPDSISLAKIEILLRRNNPTLSEMIAKYHPRMTRLAREVADEYPEEPDPSREGEFWPPKKVEFEPFMGEEAEEMMREARGGGASGG